MHQHVKVIILVAGTRLRVMPTFSSNWYDISGGVEINEDPCNAAKREVMEELGIQLVDLKYLKSKFTIMKIPILTRGIKTITHYYIAELPFLPKINLNKKEIKLIKLGSQLHH
jgi:8-oxo-dGTP pyrophosphatase MutT (NUDIX family)